ncbi:MAG TPA: amidohydrolase family protein [Terriglobia bacterium]|nr:amidohydrolase family protein [Terriglobia bacterium]
MGQPLRTRKVSKTIDIHAHYFPTEYLDLLDRFGGSETGTAIARNCLAGKEDGDLEARFRVLEEAGIDMQVLSIPPQAPYFENEQQGMEAARLANDLCAGLARQYPQRFKVFACFPLPHIDASLKELARGMDELGMVGAVVATSVRGKSIADPAFSPLFAELNRRRAVLFIHPVGIGACSPCIVGAGLTWPVGAPFEDTICALELMKANIPARYPNLKIILSHLGGTLPFLMRRLDHQAPMFMSKDSEKPSVLARSFWYDTVNGHRAALSDACECYGADRILMGTDYPYWRTEMKLCVNYIREACLPTSDVVAILGGTAQKLLAPQL